MTGPARSQTQRDPARGPAPGWLRWLTPALAAIYARVIAARNARFDTRAGVVEFDRPVISVGNLSVGGTGKTPMVQHLISVLRSAGHHPCVAMRGFSPRGGRAGSESDEAQEYLAAFRDLPIVARPDRVAGLLDLFGGVDGEQIDAVILDDGFQHRKVWRELDIVLIDATASPFDDRLLPAGWLREPVDSLRRAGAVVVTHAERVSARQLAQTDAAIVRVTGRPATAVCRHSWHSLAVFEHTHEHRAPVGWLAGKRVVAACAIGNPDAFLAAVRGAVGSVGAEFVLRDHDPFHMETMSSIVRAAKDHGAAAIVTTAKDWAKLSRYDRVVWPCPIVVPGLGLVFDRGQAGLEELVLRAALPKDRAEDDVDTHEDEDDAHDHEGGA